MLQNLETHNAASDTRRNPKDVTSDQTQCIELVVVLAGWEVE
jgi:hypothetical protein